VGRVVFMGEMSERIDTLRQWKDDAVAAKNKAEAENNYLKDQLDKHRKKHETNKLMIDNTLRDLKVQEDLAVTYGVENEALKTKLNGITQHGSVGRGELEELRGKCRGLVEALEEIKTAQDKCDVAVIPPNYFIDMATNALDAYKRKGESDELPNGL
jgi:septation ring formation regulator EzrA